MVKCHDSGEARGSNRCQFAGNEIKCLTVVSRQYKINQIYVANASQSNANGRHSLAQMPQLQLDPRMPRARLLQQTFTAADSANVPRHRVPV